MNVCSYFPLKNAFDTKGINLRFSTLFKEVCHLQAIGIPGSGTVTSVGLSMPAAFTVSNSPVTSAGTLTVVGAGTPDQYIAGDGSLQSLSGMLNADLPLVISAGVISIPQADVNNDGYLSAADHNEFHKKWGPAGNAATSGDFIGTTNAQPLTFKTNGAYAGSVSGDGKFNWDFAQGATTLGTGQMNFIIGNDQAIAGTGSYNFIGGFQSNIGANVIVGLAFGYNTRVNYNYGVSLNSGSIANAQGAFAANNAQVNAFNGAGFGKYNEIATDTSTPTTTSDINRIFVIGNGSATSHRHNALTVLQGSDLLDGTKPLFGFNTLTPTSTIDVAGSAAFKYVAKTADYTANELDYTIHFTSSTDIFTLPTAVGCTGRIYVVKNTSGNVLTLATTSGQTIDGSAPTTIANGTAAQFQSTGANWIKITPSVVTEAYGTNTQSGDGATTLFTIAHGLSSAPSYWNVQAASNDASNTNIKYVEADATNITIHYYISPIIGTSNLTWTWAAKL